MEKQYVLVKKMGECEHPEYRAAKWENYVPGEYNHESSLPVDYTMEGWMQIEPSVGQRFHLIRTKRNGIEIPGEALTSLVKTVDKQPKGWRFSTQNSIYYLEILEKDN